MNRIFMFVPGTFYRIKSKSRVMHNGTTNMSSLVADKSSVTNVIKYDVPYILSGGILTFNLDKFSEVRFKFKHISTDYFVYGDRFRYVKI